MPNEIAYYDDENGNRSYFADDTAREQIADLSTVKIGTFTKDSTQSSCTPYLSIRQVGKVVSIQGYISGLTVGNTTLGKISGVGFPPIPVRALGNSTNQPWETGDAVHTLIDTDGTLISRITKTVVNISITYIV